MILEREGRENTREKRGTKKGEREVKDCGWKTLFIFYANLGTLERKELRLSMPGSITFLPCPRSMLERKGLRSSMVLC